MKFFFYIIRAFSERGVKVNAWAAREFLNGGANF